MAAQNAIIAEVAKDYAWVERRGRIITTALYISGFSNISWRGCRCTRGSPNAWYEDTQGLHKSEMVSLVLARATCLCALLLCSLIARAQESSKPIELRVQPDGAIVWNGVPVDDAVFQTRLALMSRLRPKPQIHVLPNRRATYTTVEHVIKMLQPYGFQLGLVGNVSARATSSE